MLPTEPKHMDETKGIVGLILTIISPLVQIINPGIQLLGAILGIILLVVSIKNRLLEKKKQKLEIEILEQQKKQFNHEKN